MKQDRPTCLTPPKQKRVISSLLRGLDLIPGWSFELEFIVLLEDTSASFLMIKGCLKILLPKDCKNKLRSLAELLRVE
jgi:hypothetical protein